MIKMPPVVCRACCGIFLLLSFVVMAGCAQPKKADNQIEVWHWMTDRQDAFDALAAKYEAETGIKVRFDLFAPSDAYTQKIIAAAQANVLPDVYGILDKKAIVASFIKAGFVADLTADFAADNGAWESSLVARAVDINRFSKGNADDVKPGIYGVPLDIGSEQMLYNRTLLKKAGITKVPATFAEWLTAINALRRVGIAPFVTGFGELWIVDCFALNYAFNIMGEDKVLDTFRGKVKYTDPDWIKVFTIFKTLRDKGGFIDGIVTKGNKVAEQDFALERAAFAFNGAWAVNVYKSMNPALDYGVAPLPAMNAVTPMVSWGGAETSFVVNNLSPNKARAIAFMKWLTAKDQQVFLSRKINTLPANRHALADSPGNLADFAKAVETSTHPKSWPVNEDALVSDAFQKGIQAIIIGESTPQSVAADVQKVKDRQMGKRKY
ncbi:MAG: extracellular solute-binding protein [Candidatus Omnitrophica bacterium]|nr:extracellular solute-binding protein [Candidatus Omnitrophota bacterium]